MKRILIIEDEKNIRKIIKDYLKKENYKILEAEDGEEGLNKFFENNIDLVILDIMLPKIDGWSVCKQIRHKNKEVYILMLTARDKELDEIFGFELGADEYITKPFSPRVLVAKINRIFKKNLELNKSNKIKIEKLLINKDSHRVYYDNNLLNLSPKEYELLLYLIENKNIVLSREKILDNVWGYNFFGDVRTVDTHIKKLRKKIENNYIETIRGYGYMFSFKEIDYEKNK
ncbi:DNA-binding response OmpR family regulator [Hypnocyclicus thermotrophus]|uniref:DNA-binding response OmpR family regulator n=1 Tax=Hypnocyclicus thermotrophus TaxID=1627895 RepID=A0AA46DXW2_9FUSO|nr:response regulator transcription factor [Hypnocyclicus thermotrophus]TDT68623.1 DNA-binding response OmpR family regulator [Hypnocyclicus thermotrophus]